jgi:hypothetical protein
MLRAQEVYFRTILRRDFSVNRGGWETHTLGHEVGVSLMIE